MSALALPEDMPPVPEQAILVVPHAGGSAGAANPLRAACPETWLVAGVQFAGRESRFDEDPVADLAGLVADVRSAVTELAEVSGRPVVLLGQCSGALLGYLSLVDGTDGVACLVAVSRLAPDFAGATPDVTLADDEFATQVADLGGVPAEVAAMPELMELLLPVLRADFSALASYRPVAPVRLDVPVLAVRAAGDPACAERAGAGWERFGNPAWQREIDGDHFLLAGNPAGLAALLDEELPRLLGAREGAGRARID